MDLKEEKKFFIAKIEEKGLESADNSEIKKYKEYVEELVSENDEHALRTKALACLCGNKAYAKDVFAARDCLIKLVDNFANTEDALLLGNIYSSGCCNNGEREFEKAYHSYSIAAAGGDCEASYKMADMFLHGNGVAKNRGLGFSIFYRLYKEKRNDFLNGDIKGHFADVAFRMGHRFKYPREDEMPDFKQAYRYYLQAKYAIAQRMAVTEFEEDKVTAARIETLLSGIANDNPGMFSNKTAVYSSLYDILKEAVPENRRMCVGVKNAENGSYELKFRLMKDGFKNEAKLFITVPETNYCGMVDELVVKFNPLKSDYDIADGEYIFNEVSGNTLEMFKEKVLDLNGEFMIDLNN